MLYAYVKKQTKSKSVVTKIRLAETYKSRLPKKAVALLSISFFLAGLFLVGQVVYPIAKWYLFIIPSYPKDIISPVSTAFFRHKDSSYPAPVIANETSTTSDSYNVSTWFVGLERKSNANPNLKIFTLSIPKLKIDQATVIVGGEDLKKSLIAWPTSSPPGAYGNTIIFGHSELPQFSNPKEYSGIFSFLMDLVESDEIYTDYDGVRYKYVVIDKKIIDPTDLSVLESHFDASYLTIITCVPPGTVWKRGVIVAKLTQI